MINRPLISNKLIALGDSHVDMFTYFCFASCRIVGATAYGLVNGLSITNSRQAFLSFINSFPESIPLICVGEVDCNSVVWKQKNYEEFIDLSVENLISFIEETKRKFIISSVILPPVDSYIGMHIRPLVKATKQQRTEIVKLFNNLLNQKSTKLGHYFLDITTPTTASDGFVDERYIISPKDVHLSPYKMADIIGERLSKVDAIN